MVATGRDGVIPWCLGLLGIMSAFVQHMAGGALIGRDGTSRNGYAVIPLGAESRHCRGFHASPLGGSGFRPAASQGGRAWRSACSACSAALGAPPDSSRLLAVPRSRSEDAVPEAGTWTGPDKLSSWLMSGLADAGPIRCRGTEYGYEPMFRSSRPLSVGTMMVPTRIAGLRSPEGEHRGRHAPCCLIGGCL